MTLAIEAGGHYYAFFYLLAFVLGFPLMLYEGWRRKFPMVPWMLMVVAINLLFIAGTKLIAYSAEEWKYLFTHWQFPQSTKKSVLGGIVVAVLLILPVARYVYKFNLSLLDPFAIVLPLSMAIQRVGCLLTGCCFGKPVDLPWAITYSCGTWPYDHHLHTGLIDYGAAASLPVHPTQLYQIIYCLVIALVIYKARNRIKAPGNLLFSSVMLYGVFRFFSEFLRDPVADIVGGSFFWKLKYVQWGLAVITLTLLLFILIREKYSRKRTLLRNPPVIKENALKNLGVLICIVLATWLLRNWFARIELLVLYIFLVPGVTGVFWQLYKALTIRSLRWLPASLFLVCLIIMGQNSVTVFGPDEQKSYHSFSIGAMFGEYEDYIGGGCGGVGYYIDHKYSGVGLAYSYTHLSAYDVHRPGSEFRKGVFSLGGYYGTGKSYLQSDGSLDSELTVRILSPSYHHDWRWLGLGGGLHIGNMYIAENYSIINILPQLDVRFGPYDILFADVNIASHFPSGFPTPQIKYGIGTSFGTTNGSFLKIGGTDSQAPYITGALVIQDKLVVEPYFAARTGMYSPMYSLTLRYRFGQRFFE